MVTCSHNEILFNKENDRLQLQAKTEMSIIQYGVEADTDKTPTV